MGKLKLLLIKLCTGQIIGADKMLHFAFCYIIASFFESYFYGFVAVWFISVLKELIDKYVRKPEFDHVDIIAGILGCLFYIFRTYLMQNGFNFISF